MPFPIQAATLPNSLAGRDVLGRGRTGSGKTLAFGLALLARTAGQPRRARQPAGPGPGPHPGTGPAGHRRAHPVRPRRQAAAGHRRRRHVDRPAGQRAARAAPRSSSPRPGGSRTSSSAATAGWTRSRITVLDEADQMADMGFMPQVTELLDQVAPGRPADAVLGHPRPQRRPAGPPLPERPGRALGRPVRRRGHHDGAPRAARRTSADKNATTTEIAARDGRVIMFLDTKHAVDRLTKHLLASGVRAAGAARRQVPAAAHPHPGPVQDRPRHRAGRHQRRGPRHPRRRPRPGRQRRPAQPTTRTTCTAAAAPPAPASPAASSPWCCPTSAAR